VWIHSCAYWNDQEISVDDDFFKIEELCYLEL
jgi:hypothetical protein